MDMNIPNHDEDEEIKFDEIKLRKTLAISRQILLYFVDFYRWYLPIFDKRRIYRIPFKMYDKFREKDKDKFRIAMYRLQRAGLIRKYFDGKEQQIEILPKGKKQLKTYIFQDLIIPQPVKWDKKWRIVVYDIADDKKDKRDVFRNKLENLGFLKLQESVYIYPFDCLQAINLIKNMYFLTPCVQYIVAERVETEIKLIKKFYDRGILKKNML